MLERLIGSIKALDDWKTKEPAQLLAELKADNWIKKPQSERVWSIAGIAKEFGVQIAETIYAALIASNLNGIAARFAATGLDATDPQWLANADALIAGPLANLPAETQQALKRVAFVNAVAYPDPLTEQEVAEAKTVAINQEDAAAILAEIQNDWINPAIASGNIDGVTLRAEIKAGL